MADADTPVKYLADCETGEVTTEPLTADDRAEAAAIAAASAAMTADVLAGVMPDAGP